jgi:hypothetical protein
MGCKLLIDQTEFQPDYTPYLQIYQTNNQKAVIPSILYESMEKYTPPPLTFLAAAAVV